MNKLLVLIIILHLFACDGESKSKDSPISFKASNLNVEISGPESSYENKIEKITLNIESLESYQTEWSQTEGPLAFISDQSENHIEFIIPNIMEDQTLTFTAKTTSDTQLTSEKTWSINVRNIPTKLLSSIILLIDPVIFLLVASGFIIEKVLFINSPIIVVAIN